MTTQPSLSVVVCSYNGAVRLGPCLDALSNQQMPVDVLVVDDGSIDGTDTLAKSHGFSVFRHQANRGISAARDSGLQNAVSTIVAFCDDDCTPPLDWTERILAAWKDHPGSTIIGGMVEVDHPKTFTQRYLVFRNPLVPAESALADDPSFRYRLSRQFRPPRFSTTDVFPVYSVVGANMSVHRARALEAGGFDESLVFGEGEEVVLSINVRERYGKYAAIVDPRVVLAFRFDPSILKTLRRSFAYGRGAGERWRKRGGWPSLPVVGPAAVIVAVIVGLFSWSLGLVAGVAVLAMPWAFWISRTTERRNAGMLAYPFAALTDDLASLIGFARGVSRKVGGPSKGRWTIESPSTLTRRIRRIVSEGTSRARLPTRKLLESRLKKLRPTVLWLVVAIVLSIALNLSHSPLRPLPGVATLLLLPGATIMAALKTRPVSPAGRLVLAVSLSMMAIMVVGGAASLVCPHIGLADPLNPLTEWIFWILLTLIGLSTCAFKQRDPVTWIFQSVRVRHVYIALASGLFVVLSLLGVAQLNYSGNNQLAALATTVEVVALLVGVVGGWSRSSRWPLNTLLYGVSLALLLSTSLRGAHLYGWDIQKEFGVAARTLGAGVWVIPANHDPFASMLSLTVLPAILHSLTGLRLLAFFQLVVPAVLALLPVAVFCTVKSVPRWVNRGRRSEPRPGLAFAVVTGLIISSVAFSSLLVSITRQAMAITIFAVIVMVVFDRTMSLRPSRIVLGLLIVTVSFTHYATSYLLAGTLVIAWGVGFVWSKGWLGTKRATRPQHRHQVRSRTVLNSALVAVALVSALGWNLAITRNNALAITANAFSVEGAGLKVSAAQGSALTAPEFEKVMAKELAIFDPWIISYPDSSSVHLTSRVSPQYKGLVHGLSTWWSRLNFLFDEGLWVLLGLSVLYGLLRLGRRQSDLFSADLIGLAVAGLVVGALARFSGTLAVQYTPERAAIVVAILLAAPVTMFLDDLATAVTVYGKLLSKVSLAAGMGLVVVYTLWATGLGTLLFGGYPPGSLTGHGLNAQQFTVSTSEFATANWIRDHANSQDIVQTDLFGQLALLSVPGKYALVSEIVPPGVDVDSYVYLSTPNLRYLESQAETPDLSYYSQYRSTIAFFNENFSVVYSTGSTRVYR